MRATGIVRIARTGLVVLLMAAGPAWATSICDEYLRVAALECQADAAAARVFCAQERLYEREDGVSQGESLRHEVACLGLVREERRECLQDANEWAAYECE